MRQSFVKTENFSRESGDYEKESTRKAFKAAVLRKKKLAVAE
jgi:hypothetical protein